MYVIYTRANVRLSEKIVQSPSKGQHDDRQQKRKKKQATTALIVYKRIGMPPKPRQRQRKRASSSLPTNNSAASASITAGQKKPPALTVLPQPLPYGRAQDAFVQATRNAIDSGQLTASTLAQNWQCLSPSLLPNQLLTPTDFYYVKPIAVWVPHLIVPGFVPFCPHCQTPDGIDIGPSNSNSNSNNSVAVASAKFNYNGAIQKMKAAQQKQQGNNNKNNKTHNKKKSSSKWVKNPKVLYGLDSHRYLDTKLYYCQTCNKHFNGTHLASLALGHSRLLGRFPFYCPPHQSYAIDAELFPYIVAASSSSGSNTPAVLAKTLKNMVQERYNQTLLRYLLDCQAGRVLPQPSEQQQQQQQQQRVGLEVSDGPAWKRLRSNPLQQQQQQQQVATSATKPHYTEHAKYPTLLQLQQDLIIAEQKAKDNIDFKTLLAKKNSRNNIKLDLPALGRAKLEKILAAGIDTARQFHQCATRHDDRFKSLRAEAKNPLTVDAWATMIESVLLQRETVFNELTTQIRELEEELGIVDDEEEESEDISMGNTSAKVGGEKDNESQDDESKDGDKDNDSDSGNDSDDDSDYKEDDKDKKPKATVTTTARPNTTTNNITTIAAITTTNNKKPKYANFSAIDDREGYNARFVVQNTIKDVLAENFNNQRFVYMGRMVQLGGSWLRLHFLYHIGNKVIANTKNNGGIHHPYKCMAVILNEHGLVIWWAMIRKEGSIDDIISPLGKLKERLDRLGYTVSSIFAEETSTTHKLQKVFKVVVLDVYDWIKAWNKILSKPTSVIAATFRALMCQAVLGISLDQFKYAKRQVKARRLREPTVKEVLRECQAPIPVPEEQERNAMNVLYYFYHMEVKQELNRRPETVSNGLASRMFVKYDIVAKTAEEQLAVLRNSRLSDQESATAKSEIAELTEQLNTEVFVANRGCGVRRAERGIWAVLTEWNAKLLIKDEGEEVDITQPRQDVPSGMTLEARAIAKSLGMEEPPLQVVDSGHSRAQTEHLGFDLALEDTEAGPEFEAYLDNMVYDIEDDTTGRCPQSLGAADVLARHSSTAEDPPEQDDALLNEQRAKAISKHSRGLESFIAGMQSGHMQSSLDTFQSLSNAESWAPFLECTPFRNVKDDPFDKEERAVFYNMKKLGFDANSLESYTIFQKAWQFEVGNRLKERCNRASEKMLINRKSVSHLFDQHDLAATKAKQIGDCIDKKTLGRFCVTCGFARKKHLKDERFGAQCLRDYCARCGALKKWHDQYDSRMGFYCLLTAAQTGMSEQKIIDFDNEWRKPNEVAFESGTGEALGVARYVPMQTRLLRTAEPSKLTLPIREKQSDTLPDLFKVDNEPFSVSIIRAMEERFIDEQTETVYSPLRLWTKEYREGERYKMYKTCMVKVHEWAKAYFALRVLRALDFGAKDGLGTLTAYVKVKPPGRDATQWLDIAIEVANNRGANSAMGSKKVVDLSG